MNLNIPIKTSGSTLSADEFNLIAPAVNSKADESLLSGYLTLTGATSTYQLKGSYLVAADVVGKYLTTGTTFNYNDLLGKPNLFSGSYTDLSNKPTIPSIAGLASETYVNTKVADLVSSAPSTLDTLNELAAALGNDPNFATTVATQIGLKANTLDVYSKSQIDAKAFLTGVTYAQISGKPDLTLKADLVSGKIPTAQLPDANLSPEQFEMLPDGTIGIKTSYLQSLGLGGLPTLIAPASLSISGATATAMTIYWQASNNATSYQLERANNNAFTGSTILYTGATTSIVATGLTASTTYFFRVKAKAASYNDSTYSTISGSTSAAPSANYMSGFSALTLDNNIQDTNKPLSNNNGVWSSNQAGNDSWAITNYVISDGMEWGCKITAGSQLIMGCEENDSSKLFNSHGFEYDDGVLTMADGGNRVTLSPQPVIGDYIILKRVGTGTVRMFKETADGTRTEYTLPTNYINPTGKNIHVKVKGLNAMSYPQYKA